MPRPTTRAPVADYAAIFPFRSGTDLLSRSIHRLHPSRGNGGSSKLKEQSSLHIPNLDQYRLFKEDSIPTTFSYFRKYTLMDVVAVATGVLYFVFASEKKDQMR